MSPVRLLCLALCLSVPEAGADTVKCRIGDRTVYQDAPCPAGAADLPMAASAPAPDLGSVDAAQRRALSDKEQLQAIEMERHARDRAERAATLAAQADAKQQARLARKLVKKCAALSKEIKAAQAKVPRGNQPPADITKHQAAYQAECQPR